MSIPGSPAKRSRSAEQRPGGKPGGSGAKGGGGGAKGNNEGDSPAKAKTTVPPRPGKKRPSGPGRRPAPAAAKRPPRGRAATAQRARHQRNVLAAVAVAVVVVVIAVFVIVKATSSSSSSNTRLAINPAQLAKITTPVPVATLNAAVPKAGSNVSPPTPISGPPRLVNGKPQLLYIGAEFCPICATERWPLTVALSQFGTFTNLRQIHSAADDGNIATLTYYQASYSSPYLTFTTYEVEDRNSKPLETPSPAADALWVNATKSVPNGPRTFPFIDMNGKWQLTSAQFNDNTFSNASFATIANSIGDNTNVFGAYIDAAASQLVKSICGVIGNKAPVCTAPGS